ncbi:MAG: indole-3-glycerol phosphate synthase TrpC, partial [Nitrospirae bacterium]
FLGAITRPEGQPIRFIAELKKASPSEGIIREDFDHLKIASIYEEKGASAISVLTEEDYFKGSISYLRDLSKVSKLPLLRKDFIVDEYQIYEAATFGADAVLLIAAALSKTQAEEFFHLATELGLHSVVEVHHWKELEDVMLFSPPIIGINNRDLRTLKVDLRTTEYLIKDIPEGHCVVSESGIKTRDDVLYISSLGVDAILIGTTLMKAKDIGKKIEELFYGKD